VVIGAFVLVATRRILSCDDLLPMSEITPTGESLRRALRYVSDQLREDTDKPLLSLVDEASQRFELTPKQAEYVIRFYREELQRKTEE
jgi:hypothetical protein